jgi:ketosteroid isomerase-like protein
MSEGTPQLTPQQAALVATVKEYFVRGDAGRADTTDLFTDDVQIYFPKFGIAQGKAAFGELATGLIGSVSAFAHDLSTFSYIVSGDSVVVEGTTFGVGAGGRKWRGGETPGGRFASVFKFRDGLIARMHIYLDPDYVSQDTDRFLWGDKRTW